MMKYMVLFLPMLVMGCANSVDVENKAEYKCGNQIVTATYLEDDSVIAKIDGVNYVLTRVASAQGNRFENVASQITFLQNGSDVNLAMRGYNYPLCQEIDK